MCPGGRRGTRAASPGSGVSLVSVQCSCVFMHAAWYIAEDHLLVLALLMVLVLWGMCSRCLVVPRVVAAKGAPIWDTQRGWCGSRVHPRRWRVPSIARQPWWPPLLPGENSQLFQFLPVLYRSLNGVARGCLGQLPVAGLSPNRRRTNISTIYYPLLDSL